MTGRFIVDITGPESVRTDFTLGVFPSEAKAEIIADTIRRRYAEVDGLEAKVYRLSTLEDVFEYFDPWLED